MEHLEPALYFDLVVIGSGPAALALVARILESRPAALYTEDEHAHLHWLQRGGRHAAGARPLLKVGRGGRMKGEKEGESCACDGTMNILVMDRLGGWMANWDRLFAAYEISHLRSPLFFHPAPYDLDALVAFAQRSGLERKGGKARLSKDDVLDRDADLIEIPGCVGKEISKHKHKQNRRRTSNAATATSMGHAVNERDRKDYFVPSTQLFRRFIEEDVVKRYGLHNDGAPWPDAGKLREQGGGKAVQMVKAQVSLMRWTDVHVRGSECIKAFCLDLEGGHDSVRVAASAVVCATGPGPMPNVAPPLLQTHDHNAVRGPGWCHSTQIGLEGRKILPSDTATSLLIIGGGLTSAQLCDVALRQNPRLHVHLAIRRHMQIKPFDVGLSWVGKYANLEKMQFWQEDDPEARLAKLLAARNGGSITPRYAKLLKVLQQQGRLTIHTCTEIVEAKWQPNDSALTVDDGRWTLALRDTGRKAPCSSLAVDYIISATGAAPRLENVPFMAEICGDDRLGVKHYGGLPFLTENLQYGDELPLFFTGAFSALQIGPGAFNLEGMRAAADRIAVRLQELASPPKHTNLFEEGREDTNVTRPSHYTHFAYDLLPQGVEA